MQEPKKDIKIGIYKITSPSGKVYIGQTINVYKRWEYDYKPLNCKGQPKLLNSLKKYGYEAHKFEVLEECKLKQLSKREVYYKKLELKKVNNNFQRVLFCELYDGGGGSKK